MIEVSPHLTGGVSLAAVIALALKYIAGVREVERWRAGVDADIATGKQNWAEYSNSKAALHGKIDRVDHKLDDLTAEFRELRGFLRGERGQQDGEK